MTNSGAKTFLIVAAVLLGLQVLAETQNSYQSIQADGIVRPSTRTGTREAYLPEIFASSHAANLIVLGNGDLLCFWFSGTWEGQSDVAIVMSRLPKGAQQWSKPQRIDHQTGKSFQNPVPFESSPGRIYLFHTSQSAGEGQADSQVLWTRSDDNGRSWPAPVPLFTKPGSFIRQPMVRVSPQEWMLPMYYTPSRGITKGAESNYSATELTKDRGKHWRECVIPKSSGLVQPNVLKLSNNVYLAFFRSRYADFIYQSISTDGCKWPAPTPTVLPNNNSSMQAFRLADGHIVMAFNNVSSTAVKGKPTAGPRVPLSVALSADDGKTWPWVRDLETGALGSAHAPAETEKLPDKPGREEYSYPSVVQMPDGRIAVAYTYLRETIKVVTFPESWIKQGTTLGEYKGLPPR